MNEEIRNSGLSTAAKNVCLRMLLLVLDSEQPSIDFMDPNYVDKFVKYTYKLTLEDIARVPYNDWKKYRGFGVKTIAKVKSYLDKRGIKTI